MSAGATLRRTALYDEHVRLGARLVPFAGFEMPVQYAGILAEHDAVRGRAGMFDLSHMAQFELRGEGVAAWADELTINHVATMKPFQARYNVFCRDDGGALDDVLFYRLADRYLLVVNAANAEKIWAHLMGRIERHDVTLTNLHGYRALIALQGPAAVTIVAPLADIDLGAMRYYFCAECRVAGIPAVVARTGYTGEDGFELFVDGHDAPALWRALEAAGAGAGLAPAGLGARDMLRLEAGMPLYGHELTEEISPLAAGLGWAVKFEKPDFLGKLALERQRDANDYDRIVGLMLDGRIPARDGYDVTWRDRRVGGVRSATIAPSVGNRNIATALVERDASAAGTELGVVVRGTPQAARVVSLPFYKRAKTS